jgi:hypothetical protein
MPYRLRFSTAAQDQYTALEAGGASTAKKLKKIRRALALLEHDPRHPGLHSHQYQNFPALPKAKVWDSYVENKTPGAWRIFWMYGPDEADSRRPVPVITVVAITAHP